MLVGTTEQVKRIAGREALARSFEDTDRQLAQHRLPEQDSWKENERRLGRGMTHVALFNYVRKYIHSVVMETSFNDPAVAGFYSHDTRGKRYLVAFNTGFLPEWSIITTDRADLPCKERRGWRTVLLHLLKRRAITFSQVSEIVRTHYGYTPADWNKYWHYHVSDFK
jgi:hypothetical protein